MLIQLVCMCSLGLLTYVTNGLLILHTISCDTDKPAYLIRRRLDRIRNVFSSIQSHCTGWSKLAFSTLAQTLLSTLLPFEQIGNTLVSLSPDGTNCTWCDEYGNRMQYHPEKGYYSIIWSSGYLQDHIVAIAIEHDNNRRFNDTMFYTVTFSAMTVLPTGAIQTLTVLTSRKCILCTTNKLTQQQQYLFTTLDDGIVSRIGPGSYRVADATLSLDSTNHVLQTRQRSSEVQTTLMPDTSFESPVLHPPVHLTAQDRMVPPPSTKNDTVVQ